MSSSEKFAEYMLRSRAQAMTSLHKYDLQVGRLYLDLAEEVKAELKAASGFKQYQLRMVLNSLMKSADQATEGFKGVIDKAMLESADIQTRGFARAMADYWDAIDPARLGIDPKRMLIKVPDRAVKMVYLRTHENGLHLADSIWRLGQNSRQGVARLVTEAVARGFHYDDPRLAQQLDRFLQPTRWETATVKGKKVTRPKRVSKTITRSIKDPKTGEISKYTFRQRPVSYDAARILRTEVTNAYKEASHLTASQNPACTGEMWVLSNFHPDIGCDCENYAVHDEGLGEGVFSKGNFPITPHPQCVVEGTVVSGPRVTGATARRYRGEVVELSIGDGENLTVTPNHPILTREGWVAAGLLNEGDQVVYRPVRERHPGVVAPTVLNPENGQVPALVEDVYRAFGESRGVLTRSVEVPAEAFHGDGEGSEICVVRTNGLLRNGNDTALSQQFANELFHGANVKLTRLVGLCQLAFGLEGFWLATAGLMSGPGPLAVLLGRALSMIEGLRFGYAPARDSRINEYSLDDLARDAVSNREAIFGLASDIAGDEVGGRLPWSTSRYPSVAQDTEDGSRADAILASQLRGGSAGEVFLREIRSIRRVPFDGHVYNLQTVEGWYSSNNIITHNCLCTAMQVVVEMDVFMGWVEDFMNSGSGKIADWYGKYGMEMAA